MCHKHRSVKEKGNAVLDQYTGVLEEVKKFVTMVCLGTVLKLLSLEGFRNT